MRPIQRRPTGVTVFAILSVLFGILGLLSAVGSLLMYFLRDSIPMGESPIDELLDNSVSYRVFYLAMLGLGVVFAGILLVAGIGLLKVSDRARKLAILYAVYAILATIVSSVVNAVFLYAPLMSQMGQQDDQQLIAVVMLVAALVSAFFSLLFPVAMLIYFLLPSVKQTFQAWA